MEIVRKIQRRNNAKKLTVFTKLLLKVSRVVDAVCARDSGAEAVVGGIVSFTATALRTCSNLCS